MMETAPAPSLRTAMVMSAGLGTRMMPLTRTRPKPLIKVGDSPLINYALKELSAGGVTEAIANVHYHADQLERYLRTIDTPSIYISDEREALLETGGGLKKARPLIGDAPFFCSNTDAIFASAPVGTAATMLRTHWHAQLRRTQMAALLLLVPLDRTLGFDGCGDFHQAADGRLTKSQGEAAPFAFTGLQILSPALLDDTPVGAFSTRFLWQKAAAADQLFGVVFDGYWLHVGTPEGVDEARAFLQKNPMIGPVS